MNRHIHTQCRNKASTLAATLALLIALLTPALAHAELKIVTTLPDLAALASEVGGDKVSVKAMVRPSEDPHYVDPRPSLILDLNKADVLIANGLELEVGWLPPLVKQSRNVKIGAGGEGYLDVSSFVRKRDVPTTTDRAQGDVHPGGNPHFMFDPRAAADVTRAISRRLARLDPDNASHYTQRGDAFAARLERLAKTHTERFASLPNEKRRVVVYHQSLTYLLDWLNVDRVAAVEPRPGIAPSPGHVASVLGTMRGSNTSVILQEEFYPRKTSQTLARMAKGQVVVINGGTRFNTGESYIDHIEAIAGKIHDALSK